MRSALATVTLAGVLIVPGGATAAGSASPYAAVLSELRPSGIPVLLPEPIPLVFGMIRSIAVIRADRGGYDVGFSPVPHCAGALSCATFHIAGDRRPIEPGETQSRGRTVRLPDGTPAEFRARDCSGASCTEASLTFTRSAAVYEIDAKVSGDDRRALQAVYANLRVIDASAVAHRRSDSSHDGRSATLDPTRSPSDSAARKTR